MADAPITDVHDGGPTDAAPASSASARRLTGADELSPSPDAGQGQRWSHGRGQESPGQGRGAGLNPRPRRRHGVLWAAIAAFSVLLVSTAVGVQVFGLMTEQGATVTWSASHPITAVEIDAGQGSVSVGSGPIGKAVVTAVLRWDFNKPRVSEAWRGDTLVVSESCTFSPLFAARDCGVDFTVHVPAATTLRATAGSGDITVQGLSGSERLYTVSGDIEAVSTSGTLWAQTESGDVTGSGLLDGTATAGAVSGDVDLEFAAPPETVTASAESGDATILVPPGDAYQVSGDTESGTRTIDPSILGANATRRITIDTVSGDAVVQAQRG